MTQIHMPGADLDVPWCEEETPTLQTRARAWGGWWGASCRI